MLVERFGIAVGSGVGEVSAINSVELAELSKEIGRISQRMSDLYKGRVEAQPLPHLSVSEDFPTAAALRSIIRSRRSRDKFLPAELFADPAWDILLDLLLAHIEQTRVSVSSLSIAAAVPATTALRWIALMTEQGLLERQCDPHDGRRIFINLTSAALRAMRGYFQQTASQKFAV